MQRVRYANRIIPLVMITLLLASFQMPVQAHSPSSMELEYDAEIDTLTVTVSHSVSGDHRIAQIQVWKNDVSQVVRTYDPPQESTSGMDDTFTIDAVDGDVLRVTATCSVSGSITESLTVSISGTTTTTTTTTTDTSTTETTTDTTTTDTTTPPPSEIPTALILVAGIGAAIIIIAVLLVIVKRR